MTVITILSAALVGAIASLVSTYIQMKIAKRRVDLESKE